MSFWLTRNIDSSRYGLSSARHQISLAAKRWAAALDEAQVGRKLGPKRPCKQKYPAWLCYALILGKEVSSDDVLQMKESFEHVGFRPGPCFAKPRNSKYPIFKDSGPENRTLNGFLGPESLNIWYLDTLGKKYLNMLQCQTRRGTSCSFTWLLWAPQRRRPDLLGLVSALLQGACNELCRNCFNMQRAPKETPI